MRNVERTCGFVRLGDGVVLPETVFVQLLPAKVYPCAAVMQMSLAGL